MARSTAQLEHDQRHVEPLHLDVVFQDPGAAMEVHHQGQVAVRANAVAQVQPPRVDVDSVPARLAFEIRISLLLSVSRTCSNGRGALRIAAGGGTMPPEATPMFESSPLLQSLRQTWSQVVGLLPDLGLALVLLVAGWLVAKLVRRIAVRVLRAAHVDEIAERSGLDDFLVQGGVEVTTVTLIAGALYWLILAGVFVTLLDALGVHTAGVLIQRVTQFVPNLVLAVGVLVFGSLFARVVGGVIVTYLHNVGSGAAEPIGALARYAVLIFVLFMAAEQLAIQTAVLVSAFQIAFAAICLAAALAFGLGGRDWAAQIIARYTRR